MNNLENKSSKIGIVLAIIFGTPTALLLMVVLFGEMGLIDGWDSGYNTIEFYETSGYDNGLYYIYQLVLADNGDGYYNKKVRLNKDGSDIKSAGSAYEFTYRIKSGKVYIYRQGYPDSYARLNNSADTITIDGVNLYKVDKLNY